MGNTAETLTKAAGIFKLGQSAFLHTTTGRCVTFAAGWAALFTATATKDAGLAAACAALFPPALIGSLLGRDIGTLRLRAAIFATAIASATGLGDVTARQNNQQEAHLQSLPTMDPNKTITITAKERFCGPHQRGWIKIDGQKLNCGN